MHQSQTFSSHISLLSAPATRTSLAVPWCTTVWCGSRLTVTADVECVSRVLLHGSQPEPQATGVRRLGPDCVFLYCNIALSSHYSFFRASLFLKHSLMEYFARWTFHALVVLYVQEDHTSTSRLSALFHTFTHIEKVCSSPLFASDVQYYQEFCTPGQYVRDLN